MPSFRLSQFGQLMDQDSPIVSLMADLGEALNVNPDLLFLGGGNPAFVPKAQALFTQHIQELSGDAGALKSMLGIYQSPQGNEQTLTALADYFQHQCDWPVSTSNIALVNGSQTAFFLLLNLFAGESADAGRQQVKLPLVPEYLGYASQGLSANMFQPQQPNIEMTQAGRFKYTIDFDHLDLGQDVGAMCVSRPTNPTGNLLSDSELLKLSALARHHKIPLIVDLAYGQPFPSVVYRACTPIWTEDMVAVMSLSKLGLPGVRTAVVVASEEIINLVTKANTIISLANGNLGPYLLQRLLSSGDMQQLTSNILPDFYRTRRDWLVTLIEREFAGIPYRLHEPEGAFFVWLWFDQLPISSAELYQQLKQLGVLVMAGEPFFFGLDATWRHAQQCLRLTYCQDDAVMQQAVSIIAKQLRKLYRT